MIFGKVSRAVLIAALINLLTAPAYAVELSADMIIQSAAGGEMTGRVFVRDNNLRQELDTPGGIQTTIINQATGVMYILLPGQNMYMEMQNSQVTLGEGEDFEKKYSGKGKITNLGTETIEGYLCDKYQIVYNDPNQGEATIWIAREFNYPLKVYAESPQDKATILYSNISEADLADSLFTIPEGYQKFSM
jgi:hypothetical protein